MSITKEDIRRTMQVLVDNGIEPDEAATVMQAIGYTLLDMELEDLIDWDNEILRWEHLTEEEKEQAKETYLCIRECEEERGRNDISPDYPNPIDWEGVMDCHFERDNGYIHVII